MVAINSTFAFLTIRIRVPNHQKMFLADDLTGRSGSPSSRTKSTTQRTVNRCEEVDRNSTCRWGLGSPPRFSTPEIGRWTSGIFEAVVTSCLSLALGPGFVEIRLLESLIGGVEETAHFLIDWLRPAPLRGCN